MSKIVLVVSGETLSCVIEEIKSKINCAGKDGFKLTRSIRFYKEDRGENAPTLYRIVVTMSKKEKMQAEDDFCDEAHI